MVICSSNLTKPNLNGREEVFSPHRPKLLFYDMRVSLVISLSVEQSKFCLRFIR